ncbi:hypothetical protein CYMTET_19711 [Cymbomonas tetramitiformis]|uniref:RNase H type-1 domain-containing protein n=1 Tax=Cymbomonas tetramitiformis TaxID=36881 RepID=A0AAE0L4L3_9CHLO|nr:hypothetical protein CYMTET_19711 [Cymbomonas tetramitiformis]
MPGACNDPDAAEGKYIQKVLNRTRRDEQDADGCWLVDLCVDCKFDFLKSRKEIDRCRRQHEGPNWYTVVFPACGDCMVEYTTVAKRGDQTTKHVVWIKSRHPDTGLYTVQDADPPHAIHERVALEYHFARSDFKVHRGSRLDQEGFSRVERMTGHSLFPTQVHPAAAQVKRQGGAAHVPASAAHAPAVSGVTKKDYSNWGVRILVVANAEGWRKFCPDPEGAADVIGKALQRNKGGGTRGVRFPRKTASPRAARAMRQTWRDQGLTDITITEYHAANTAWPLDRIKEVSRARWLKAMERTPMLFSRQDRDRGHAEVRERFPTCPIKRKTRFSRALGEISKAWDATSFLYTDGSRLDPEEEGGSHRVGAAYWDPRGDESPRTWRGTWSTGGHLTINRAELLAIHAALRARECSTPNAIAICTDSLCSMYQILNMLSRPHTMECHRHRDLLEDILSLVEQHNSRGTEVSLRKVKSHTGVKGNDKADEAAKQAAENKEGTAQIEPWDNRTMYTLTANARDGESMRPLHGDGAVERYVAGRIALKSAQHKSVRKWLQPPSSP